MIWLLLASGLFALAESASAEGDPLVGAATVRGPDVLAVRGARVKLAGVMAPPDAARCAGGAACVEAGAAALAELVATGPVTCAPERRLGHGYFLGQCRTADGTDPAVSLLARGLLQLDPQQAARDYVEAAAAARDDRVGMWAD